MSFTHPSGFLAFGIRLAVAVLAVGTSLAQAASTPATPLPSADSTAPALALAQRDVASAADALNQARDTIAAKRLPLAKRLESVQREVEALRIDVERRRTVQRQGELEREALANRVHGLEMDANFVFTALQEYRRSFETRVGPAGIGPLAPELAKADRDLTSEKDYATLPQSADALLALAERWNLARLGGDVFPGACLDPGGRELAGTFAVAGPLAFFAADAGAVAGPVGRRIGSINPSLLVAWEGAEAQTVAAVAARQEATLAVDVSGGDALRVIKARGTLWSYLKSGGILMIPLIVVGGLGVMLIVSRILYLRRVRPPSLTDIDPILDLLEKRDVHGALAAAQKIGGPVGEILHEGISHRGASTETLEEILHERVLGLVPALDRHLGMIAVLGASAPLLGLLGTVTGIMHTFHIITLFGSGDARLLSGGIAEALVCTQMGLFIAIPMMLIHAYLARRVRNILSGLEQMVVAFVNRVKPPVEPVAA